ncbi:MAG: YtxH domain-containing protein [Bacteroidetes bacterium]|nr:MAG: YtxH domain-containing protein [Bacteroidota bacterium]
MKDFTKMMFFLSAGFAAGAIAGILFAPDKGEITRGKVREKANELGDDVAEKYDEEIERLQNKIDDLKDRFADEVIANVVGNKVNGDNS